MLKKYIHLEDAIELLERLLNGTRVQGVLFMDKTTGKLTFKPYYGRGHRKKDRLICRMEHGWVKESAERIKLYDSVPKNLGAAYVSAILERETKVAKDALLDRELDMIEVC